MQHISRSARLARWGLWMLPLQMACSHVEPAGGTSRAALETAGSREAMTITSSFSAERTAVIPAFNGVAPFALSIGHADGATFGVFFSRDAQSVTGYAANGEAVWTRSIVNTDVTPTYDFNLDGVPDLFIAERDPSLQTVTCYDDSHQPSGSNAVASSTLHLASGSTGATIQSFGSLPDFCWSHGGKLDTFQQWTHVSAAFGSATGSFAVAPYYAEQAYIYRFDGSAWRQNTLVFPSTPAFDSTYSNAQPALPGSQTKYWANAHVFNGVFVNGSLGFFTSGRFISFSAGADNVAALDYDVPFQPGTADASGRNYGLAARDPSSSLVYIVAGCSNVFLLQDTLARNAAADPACGIHRHVSIIDTSTRALASTRFYSYANDGGFGASNFNGRVSFPAHPFVKSAAGPSRLFYNVFDAGHWSIHVTAAGTTQDLYALKDVVVWDIIDIDQDGIDEILYSPAGDSVGAGAEAYLPKRTTTVAHWDNDSTLTAVKAYADMVPALVKTPMTDSLHTTDGALYGAVRVFDRKSALYMMDASNKAVVVDY